MSAELFRHTVDGEEPTLDPSMYRLDDLDTAVGAAVIAIGNRTENKRKVLLALYAAGDDGLTDFETAAATGLIATSAGKRRLDLQREVPSLVRRASAEDGTGLTRPSPTGAPAAVWTLTAAGIVAAETLPTDGQLTPADKARQAAHPCVDDGAPPRTSRTERFEVVPSENELVESVGLGPCGEAVAVVSGEVAVVAVEGDLAECAGTVERCEVVADCVELCGRKVHTHTQPQTLPDVNHKLGAS